MKLPAEGEGAQGQNHEVREGHSKGPSEQQEPRGDRFGDEVMVRASTAGCYDDNAHVASWVWP